MWQKLFRKKVKKVDTDKIGQKIFEDFFITHPEPSPTEFVEDMTEARELLACLKDLKAAEKAVYRQLRKVHKAYKTELEELKDEK